MKRIWTLEGEPIIRLFDGDVTYKAKAAIDGDGKGSSFGDPDYQSDTSLHLNGEPLDASIDKYIVVPPQIIWGVSAIVLGCQAYALNLNNGMWTPCVVGDEGPADKIGEVSEATAKAVGLNPSPTTGGIESHVIWYHIIPGKAALVDDKNYSLQASRK